MLKTKNDSNLVEKVEKLKETRDALNNSILEDQRQLGLAKARLKDTGQYSDPNWFAGLRESVRRKTNDLHAMNRDIKAIRKQITRSNPKAVFFQEAAKIVLTPELYEEVNTMANELMKEGTV